MRHLFCPGCDKDMGDREDGIIASWCSVDCYNAHPELHPDAVHMKYHYSGDADANGPLIKASEDRARQHAPTS